MPNFFDKYPYTDFHELNLDWVLKTVKQVVADWMQYQQALNTEWGAVQQDWHDTEEAWISLKNYVENFFANLNLQQEVNTKIDEMVADGTMDQILLPYFNAYKADIDAIIAVQNQKINVLEGRMDEFASLPPGSTAGNAELLDIRVGESGTTYSSAGDAVRGQISDLMNEVYYSDMITVDNYTLINDQFRKFDGTIGTYTGARMTSMIPISSHMHPVFVSTRYGASIVGVTYFAADQSYISDQLEDSNNVYGVTDFPLVIPENAAYFVVSSWQDNIVIKASKNVKYAIEQGTSDIINLLNNHFIDYNTFIDLTSSQMNITSGEFIKSDGTTSPYTWAEHTDYIPITKMLEYRMSFRAGSSICGIYYYDENKTPISYEPDLSDMTDYTDYIPTIPSNAAYFIVSTWTRYLDGGGNYVYVHANVKETSTLDNVVRNLSRIWHDKKWMAIGDSWTEASVNWTNYHQYIANSTGIYIINKGVGGTGFMSGIDSNIAYYQRIPNFTESPDVITIMGSGNDLSEFASMPGNYMDDTSDTVGGCMNLAIDALMTKYPNAKIGILAPPPWQGYKPSVNNPDNMQRYSILLEQVCMERGIPFLNLFTESGLRPWDATFFSTYYYNYAHANSAGHEFFASKVLEFMKKLLMT